MLNRLMVILFYNLVILIFIPTIITCSLKSQTYEEDEPYDTNYEDIIDNIEYEDTSDTLEVYEKNNLDEYIIGVLAAEMPASFEEDALKAQAIAARTYAYRRIGSIDAEIDSSKIGQAYNSLETMKTQWGDNFDNYYNKIKNAVYSTAGIIITYEDEPIEAVFHSTSAGVTETAENIWGQSLPYIKSVESSLDENAPNFIYTTTVTNEDFINKIYEKLNNIDKNQIISTFKITSTSEAGYVLQTEVCGQTISGADIRIMFNLRSTNFTIQKNSNTIEFTTKGYGHGAGLSQYGANFMALNGSSYEEILHHYYSDIQLSKIY